MKFGPLAFAAALILSAPALAQDYVANAADIVKAADWKKMEAVEIELGDTGSKLFYKPEVVKLKANQPYKLVLKNSAAKPHYYTAEAFFRAVAMRKVQSKEMEVKAPYLSALEVNPGGVAELFIVPVKAGTYEVVCTIDDHHERGMVGKIVVE